MVVFPGQGSQYPGMLEKLCEKNEDMEWLLEKAKQTIDKDMVSICDNLPEEELKKTDNAQLALFFTSYCQYKWLRSHYEIEPVFFAGHSLGEITALACSGAINIETGLNLVFLRGKFMAEMNGIGKMAAVLGASEEVVQEVCKTVSNENKSVCIANYNSDNQLIISGYVEGVDQACALLIEKGYRCIMLKVSGAFHSKYMQNAADKLYPHLKDTQYGLFTAPVISNVNAKPYCTGDRVADNLYKQLTFPVLWRDTIQYAEKAGVELVIEVGPGHILKGMVQQNSEIPIISIGEEKDKARLSEFLREKNVDKDYLFLLQRCLGVSVCERNTNFSDEEYQKGVVDVYKQLTELKDKCIQQDSCTLENAEVAIKYMIQILSTKGVNRQRINARIQEVIWETNTEKEFGHLILK